MFFSFPLLKFLLFAICILSVITFYLAYLIRKVDCFSKVLLFTLFYVFVNSLYSFLIELCAPHEPWKDRLSPFILMYGPILYFGILSLRDNKLPVRIALLHSLPFLLYLIPFLGLLIGWIKSQEIQHILNNHLTILGPISFIAYTFVSIVMGRNLFRTRFRAQLFIFVFGRVFLLFFAMLFIIIAFSGTKADNEQAITLLRMMVYICMLIFILAIFNFTIKQLLVKFSIDSAQDPVEEENIGAKYERSVLSATQLKAYEERLASAMDEENLFLDATLSLPSLATHLKLPPHHLTQVFSVQIKQSFYQYINGYRVAYSCNLLEQGIELTIQEVAEKSGFNSKASFYRQFRELKGCTPSAYKNNMGTSGLS
jgi:AraC-like DNA-binding protein